MLKQLSDKLNNVFYKGPELKNMMETLDNFRRSATREEELLKENDGKVYPKKKHYAKEWFHFILYLVFV